MPFSAVEFGLFSQRIYCYRIYGGVEVLFRYTRHKEYFLAYLRERDGRGRQQAFVDVLEFVFDETVLVGLRFLVAYDEAGKLSELFYERNEKYRRRYVE